MSERFFLFYPAYGYEDSTTERRDFGSFEELVAYMDYANLPTDEATIIRGVEVPTEKAEAILAPLRAERKRQEKAKAAEAKEARERADYERLKAKYG